MEHPLVVYDVRDPAQPKQLPASSFTSPWPSDIWVADHYAYVADREAGLIVLDVTDLATPREVARVPEVPDGVFTRERELR